MLRAKVSVKQYSSNIFELIEELTEEQQEYINMVNKNLW